MEDTVLFLYLFAGIITISCPSSWNVSAVAWKDTTPDNFVEFVQHTHVTVSIASIAHVADSGWRNIMKSVWSPDQENAPAYINFRIPTIGVSTNIARNV